MSTVAGRVALGERHASSRAVTTVVAAGEVVALDVTHAVAGFRRAVGQFAQVPFQSGVQRRMERTWKTRHSFACSTADPPVGLVEFVEVDEDLTITSREPASALAFVVVHKIMAFSSVQT